MSELSRHILCEVSKCAQTEPHCLHCGELWPCWFVSDAQQDELGRLNERVRILAAENATLDYLCRSKGEDLQEARSELERYRLVRYRIRDIAEARSAAPGFDVIEWARQLLHALDGA